MKRYAMLLALLLMPVAVIARSDNPVDSVRATATRRPSGQLDDNVVQTVRGAGQSVAAVGEVAIDLAALEDFDHV